VSDDADLEIIHREIEACEVCKAPGHRLQKGYGIQRGLAASVMVIGIAPSAAARKAQKAFAGNSFNRLSKWFAAAGFPSTESQLRRAIYLTSLNKCGVIPDTEINRRKLWTRCQQFLWRQIEVIRPDLILLLGKEPVAMIIRDRNLRLKEILGKSWSTGELFGQELLPPTTVPTTWLVLPHPSGLSRTMNDEAVHKQVISSLRKHLNQISFIVPSDSKEAL
jgi:uracil-DNA glycosylase family 4